MDWGSQRRFKILATIFLGLFIILSVFVYFKFFNRAPTCFDSVMNQDEEGIDCGGVCTLVCPDESRPISIIFSRLFQVGYGSYSALAIVENFNQGVFSREINYVFKVYDSQNILLKEVFGKTFSPPGRVFPIFEHSILTGNREASKITFEIDNANVVWEKESYIDPKIRVTNISHQFVDKRSRITADIFNDEVYPMRDVQAISVVYDDQGNVRESSSTVIEYISPGDKYSVSFTWNNAFDFNISKIDIVPRVMPREWSGN